jgi:hypothetical protein
MYIPDPWNPQIKFKPGVNEPAKQSGSGAAKIRFKPGVNQIKFKPGVNASSGGNPGQIRFKPGVPNTSAPAGSSFRKAGSVLTSGGSSGGLLGTLNLTSILTPMIYGAMTTSRDALATDRGKAFTQNMTSGNYGQALRHLTGNYDRRPGLTPELPSESEANPFLAKPAEIIEVTGADGNPVRLDINNPVDKERLQKIKPKVIKSEEIPPTESDNSPLPPTTTPAPTLDNMKEATELARMTEFVKANRALAEKVKPGQAGYEEIQIALGRMPFAQVDPQAFASSAVMDFSDTLKMGILLPEGETLGVASDIDDAYTKSMVPGYTEVMKKPFAEGLNLGTGGRTFAPQARGTKPGQQFFESRTPGL